jgi:hypothetical protein
LGGGGILTDVIRGKNIKEEEKKEEIGKIPLQRKQKLEGKMNAKEAKTKAKGL